MRILAFWVVTSRTSPPCCTNVCVNHTASTFRVGGIYLLWSIYFFRHDVIYKRTNKNIEIKNISRLHNTKSLPEICDLMNYLNLWNCGAVIDTWTHRFQFCVSVRNFWLNYILRWQMNRGNKHVECDVCVIRKMSTDFVWIIALRSEPACGCVVTEMWRNTWLHVAYEIVARAAVSSETLVGSYILVLRTFFLVVVTVCFCMNKTAEDN
jgi:hypothetical protein